MNQSNLNIDKILKASLEHQKPSITFEDVWDKYSKNKGPVLVYRRIGVLVAAMVVLLVSIKLTTNLLGTNANVNISKNTVISLNEPSPTLNSNDQSSKMAKTENKIVLFSKANENLKKPNTQPKVEKEPKAKIEPRLEASAKAMPKAKTVPKAEPKAKSFEIASLDIAQRKAADSTTEQSIAMGKFKPSTTDASNGAYIIWENQAYFKTDVIVEGKDLGESLGTITNLTPNPQNNFESNEFPVGTEIYSILGEDTKLVVAVKLGDNYYRTIVK